MENKLSIDQMELIKSALVTKIAIEEMKNNRAEHILVRLDDLICLFNFEIEKAKEQSGEMYKEGILEKQDNGRFIIKYSDGEESNDLTCGTTIDLLFEYGEEWISGRIEHSTSKGYYFYGYDKSLKNGMRARIINK